MSSSWVLLWVLLAVLAALALYSAGFEHGGRAGRRLEAELRRWHLRTYSYGAGPATSELILDISLGDLVLTARWAADDGRMVLDPPAPPPGPGRPMPPGLYRVVVLDEVLEEVPK